MARPVKQGLDYFPLDVDIHDDDKIALISSEFGAIGEAILWRLLCKIYKNGYFYPWGEDECLLFCRWAGGIFVPGQVDEVVKGCIRRSIFDNRVSESFGILTSHGIQKRYLQATSERKEVEINHDFWLLEIPKNNRFKVIRPNNLINLPINGVNKAESTQSKVKESKVKELSKIQKEFYDSLTPFLKDFSKETLREFFNYWSEPNKSKTKIRWQLEKTWDTKKRLIRWDSKNFKKPELISTSNEPYKPDKW